MPLTEYTFNEENAVDRTFYGRINIKKASSFLFFTENGIVKKLIHQLKYKNQEVVGTFFGEWYGQLLKDDSGLEPIDFVIPVPLHRKKLRKRGYNQVSKFAQCLAHHLNAVCLENALIKTANTKTQTKKGRIGRWQGQTELYMISDPEKLRSKNILLVDDVITTGATIELCANALSKVEGISINVASMAFVQLYKI
ncbi:MAG: phosphoribosyltransferase family protein [Flavobacteriaceae bacterium]